MQSICQVVDTGTVEHISCTFSGQPHLAPAQARHRRPVSPEAAFAAVSVDNRILIGRPDGWGELVIIEAASVAAHSIQVTGK